MAQTTSDADHVFLGAVDVSNASSFSGKAGALTNADLATSSGARAGRYQIHCDFRLDTNETPVAKTPTVFVARAAGTVEFFYAGLTTTGSSTSVVFDLLKDGTTMLSGKPTVVHGDGDRDHKAGTLSVTTFAANDTITMDLAVTSSTGAQGPFAVMGIIYTAEPS